MLKPQDVAVATEILFGPENAVTKFRAETLSALLNPDIDESDFLMFCATAPGTWKEIARAIVAAIAANPREPWHVPIMLGVYISPAVSPELEDRDDICHNPRPEFVAGCFLGLFEAGLWLGKWERDNKEYRGSIFTDDLFRIIREAVSCTKGFMEKANPCLDDRYRSELTGTIKKYLADPLDQPTLFDMPGSRFRKTEELLRAVAKYADKERAFPPLVNMLLDGLTYGLLGLLTPMGRAQFIAQAQEITPGDSASGLWRFTSHEIKAK